MDFLVPCRFVPQGGGGMDFLVPFRSVYLSPLVHARACGKLAISRHVICLLEAPNGAGGSIQMSSTVIGHPLWVGCPMTNRQRDHQTAIFFVIVAHFGLKIPSPFALKGLRHGDPTPNVGQNRSVFDNLIFFWNRKGKPDVSGTLCDLGDPALPNGTRAQDSPKRAKGTAGDHTSGQGVRLGHSWW